MRSFPESEIQSRLADLFFAALDNQNWPTNRPTDSPSSRFYFRTPTPWRELPFAMEGLVALVGTKLLMLADLIVSSRQFLARFRLQLDQIQMIIPNTHPPTHTHTGLDEILCWKHLHIQN